MAIDEIVISSAPGEIRGAFLTGGTLQRFVIDRDLGGPRPGDILTGRITQISRPVEAAFVALPGDRSGFLRLADVRAGAEGRGGSPATVSEGDAVLVQVTRAPEGSKEARLTTRVRLPGRYVVWLADPASAAGPSSDGTHAVPTGEQDRARRLAARLPRDHGGGWLIKPPALGAPDDIVLTEATALSERFAAALEKRRVAPVPALLLPGASPVIAAVLDEASCELARIVVDDLAMATTLRAALPDLALRIERTTDASGAFAAFGVEEQVEAALAPEVALACGGRLIISPTPSVTAIDVDSGRAHRGGREATALAVNLEAADEILRQVRLRGLGGHMVIDFIPMKRRGAGAKVVQRLRDGFADERGDTNVAGFTRLGLVELTRRREGPSLTATMLAPCALCHGTGWVKSPLTVALEALRAVLAEDRARPGQAWTLAAPAPVVVALQGEAGTALAQTSEKLGRPLTLVIDERLARDRFQLAASS